MTGTADFEGLLRQALAPVEPPEHLAMRLEQRLQSITEMAAEELDAVELSAMRDPRNWARPAAAVVLGTGAGAALVVLRVRRRAPQTHRLNEAGAAVGKSLRGAERQARRLLRPR
ncbi:MAG TPA: hypothetical protein VGP17_02695 [Solirubrobacteraceae bacterium]|jgi:hypothetical protein|nr:hypothetical protein [Solirubrobacteraceae bacterium]